VALPVAPSSKPHNTYPARNSTPTHSTATTSSNAAFPDPGYPPPRPPPSPRNPPGPSFHGVDFGTDLDVDVGLPRSLPRSSGYGHRARVPSPPPPELPPKPVAAPKLPPKPKQTQTESGEKSGSNGSLNRSREIIHLITVVDEEDGDRNVRTRRAYTYR
jgi:hypothetical protein